MDSKWRVERVDELPMRSKFDGVKFREVAGEKVTFVEGWFSKGSSVDSHVHENEEIIRIMEGSMRIRLNNDAAQEVILRSGEMIVIPSNVPHGGEALEDTHAIGTYAPARKDMSVAPIVGDK